MRFSRSVPLVLALAVAAPAGAQAQARHDGRQPIAICRDGTRSAVSGRGACAGHGGVNARAAEKSAKKESKTDRLGVVQQGHRHDDRVASSHAKKSKARKAKGAKAGQAEKPVRDVKATKAPKARKHADHAQRADHAQHVKARKNAKDAKPPKDTKSSKAARSSGAADRRARDSKSAEHRKASPEHHAGLRRVAKPERSDIRIATMGAHPVAASDSVKR